MANQLALVPKEPTAEILAAAAAAAWPAASKEDIALAARAAMIMLHTSMEPIPGATLQELAAAIATMAPAYRAMIAAAPKADLDALMLDAERLDWLESEANTLRCMEDSSDIYFEVVSHHMAVPSERVEGIGKTPRQAIDAAMAAGRGEVG